MSGPSPTGSMDQALKEIHANVWEKHQRGGNNQLSGRSARPVTATKSRAPSITPSTPVTPDEDVDALSTPDEDQLSRPSRASSRPKRRDSVSRSSSSRTSTGQDLDDEGGEGEEEEEVVEDEEEEPVSLPPQRSARKPKAASKKSGRATASASPSVTGSTSGGTAHQWPGGATEEGEDEEEGGEGEEDEEVQGEEDIMVEGDEEEDTMLGGDPPTDPGTETGTGTGGKTKSSRTGGDAAKRKLKGKKGKGGKASRLQDMEGYEKEWDGDGDDGEGDEEGNGQSRYDQDSTAEEVDDLQGGDDGDQQGEWDDDDGRDGQKGQKAKPRRKLPCGCKGKCTCGAKGSGRDGNWSGRGDGDWSGGGKGGGSGSGGVGSWHGGGRWFGGGGGWVNNRWGNAGVGCGDNGAGRLCGGAFLIIVLAIGILFVLIPYNVYNMTSAHWAVSPIYGVEIGRYSSTPWIILTGGWILIIIAVLSLQWAYGIFRCVGGCLDDGFYARGQLVERNGWSNGFDSATGPGREFDCRRWIWDWVQYGWALTVFLWTTFFLALIHLQRIEWSVPTIYYVDHVILGSVLLYFFFRWSLIENWIMFYPGIILATFIVSIILHMRYLLLGYTNNMVFYFFFINFFVLVIIACLFAALWGQCRLQQTHRKDCTCCRR